MAVTVFSVRSGEVNIDDTFREVVSLTVDVPWEATYLIFVSVTCQRTGGGRIVSRLHDEAGNIISGTTINTQHTVSSSGGRQTGSKTVARRLQAGTHRLRLFVGDGPGKVNSAEIIAIPLSEAP
jgi:hypothetical protein